ncbi:MAG: biotin carboxyl carrier domain-containing protein [Myxococcales bacterium]|nr:biotin carboxyl carrier domain-containing protein [Myxococcales bacterium]
MVGELLKAPIHGIFYRRPTPAEAAYIEVGASLTRGQVVGLVEVMKSFHPVVWQGQDGRVVAILVVDLAEVAHGQPLLRVAVGGVE